MRPNLERALKATCLLVLLISWRSVVALPPVWSDSNYQQGAAPQNRRGSNPSYSKAPFKPQRALSLGKLEDDGGAASGNYSFSLPILSFPGRGGLPLSLDLHYSSQLWSVFDNGKLYFDADGDWPAPGWSLGFGKLLTTVVPDGAGEFHLTGGLLISGNRSRQLLLPIKGESGTIRHLNLSGDSLSQIALTLDIQQGPSASKAVLTDGAGGSITYANYGPGQGNSVYYPVQLADANGN